MVRFLSDWGKAWDSRDYSLRYLARLRALGFLVIMYTSQSLHSTQKTPWRREWQPTPVFLPREFHGQRSLASYSLWGHRVGRDRATNTPATGYIQPIILGRIELRCQLLRVSSVMALSPVKVFLILCNFLFNWYWFFSFWLTSWYFSLTGCCSWRLSHQPHVSFPGRINLCLFTSVIML